MLTENVSGENLLFDDGGVKFIYVEGIVRRSLSASTYS